MAKISFVLLIFTALLCGISESFQATSPSTHSRRARFVKLSAKKEDRSSKKEADEGYDLVGTLTRQGPIPAFVRVFQAEKYNQAVDKFMLQDKCGRTEAMANLDAYFNDPTGWQLKRKEFEKTGIKKDYVNLGQARSELALTAFWGTVSSLYLWRIYQYTVLGIDYKDNFWGL